MNTKWLGLWGGWWLGLSGLALAETPPVLRVGVLENPPFAFRDDQGYVQGLSVDLLTHIAEVEGWQLKFSMLPLDPLLEQVNAGKLDLLIGVPQQPEYSDWFEVSAQPAALLWGQVYRPVPSLWRQLRNGFSTSPSNTIRTMSDLNERALSVFQDDPNLPLMQSRCQHFAVQCRWVMTDSYAAAIQAVLQGNADAVLLNNVETALRPPPAELQPSGIELEPLRVGFIAPRQNTTGLLARIDAQLQAWQGQPDSYLYQARERWLLPSSFDTVAGRGWSRSLGLVLGLLLGLTTLTLGLAALLRWRLRVRTAALNRQLSELRHSEQRYRMLVESLPYGLQEIDTEGTILFTNTAEHQIRRYHQGELIGCSILDMVASAKERQELNAYLRRVVKEQPEPGYFHSTIVRKDGHTAQLRSEWQYKRDQRGNVVGFYALVSDVSETEELKQKIVNQQLDIRKVADQRAADLADAYNDLLMSASVFEHASEGILVLTPEGVLQSVNPALTQMVDYAEPELTGQNFFQLLSRRYPEPYLTKIFTVLRDQGCWRGELWGQKKNGKTFPAWVSINAVSDTHNRITHYVTLLSDITRRKQAERQIWRQAHFDHLTGLPNRNLFYQRLQQAMLQSRKSGQTAGLIFIDLDKFKEVNDSLGHDAGDELLQAVAERLRACVSKRDTVARMGGDEFTVVMPGSLAENVQATASQILSALVTPFPLKAHTVIISGSIGVVLYPQHGQDLTTLLKNADIAMYQAKEAGRDTYRVYSD